MAPGLCVLPSCEHFDGKPSPFMREVPSAVPAPKPARSEPSLHPRNIRATARKCEQCGESCRRRATEQASRYAVRRFCGIGCRDAAHRAKCTPRKCEHCGTTYERGSKEDAWAFRQRRFCSQTCSRLATSRRAA